jgi:NAD+ diphosphatase
MWEEAGVKVWNVTYHSAQPWVGLAISPALYTHCPQPFPANLMVGFYARADASQPIRLDLDNELMGKSSLLPPSGNRLLSRSDARWYTRAEVLEVLNHKLGTRIVASDHKKFAEAADGTTSKEVKESEPVVDEPPFRVPPTGAIAGVLIREWAYKNIQFAPAPSLQKGNL